MSFATAYATKRKNAKCMAKGGEVKFHHPDIRYKNERGVNAQDTDEGKRGESHAGVAVRSGNRRDAKEAHKDTIQEMRAMPKPKLPMAEGGEVDDLDMIGRIMHRYSRGGKVANDVGVAEADEMPAEYDDLVLNDDLEQHDTAENSGDMDGDAEQDMRNADVIARVLASRKKKDRMPRPA